jgi:hypothetical protein
MRILHPGEARLHETQGLFLFLVYFHSQWKEPLELGQERKADGHQVIYHWVLTILATDWHNVMWQHGCLAAFCGSQASVCRFSFSWNSTSLSPAQATIQMWLRIPRLRKRICFLMLTPTCLISYIMITQTPYILLIVNWPSSHRKFKVLGHLIYFKSRLVNTWNRNWMSKKDIGHDAVNLQAKTDSNSMPKMRPVLSCDSDTSESVTKLLVSLGFLTLTISILQG